MAPTETPEKLENEHMLFNCEVREYDSELNTALASGKQKRRGEEGVVKCAQVFVGGNMGISRIRQL